MSGYALHPNALADVEEIWQHIAQDSTEAANRVAAEIFEAMRTLVRFPHQGYAEGAA